MRFASNHLFDVLDFNEEESRDSYLMTPSGARIDISGDVWIISPDKTLRWSRFERAHVQFRNAVRAFFRYLLANNSPAYVASQFGFLSAACRETVIEKINSSIESDTVIGRDVFNTFVDVVRDTVAASQIPAYAGAWVRWYVWATDAGYPIFDYEVAAEFESLIVGSNPLGVAVLSADPNAGPLRDIEATALRSALKSAEKREDVSTSDLTLCWLLLSFGTNAKNITLLEERDLIKTEVPDSDPVYELRIPRIKKRTAGDRDQFRTRRLTPFLGRLVEKLIIENEAEGWEPGFARPLFRRVDPVERLRGTDFWPQAYRITPAMLTARVIRISDALGLKSFSGDRLQLTPRRLRYTFATRLVQEGASIQAVADALDHSSIEHVQVYFNARSDTVTVLDRALSVRLAPIAQAFLGKIVRSPSDAIRADDPEARIVHLDATSSQFKDVGTCGSFGFCDLLAPIACYRCSDFQAWLEAPHELVLEGLERRRSEKLTEGADPKWTQLYDETILAIAQVVRRCDEILAEEAA